MSRVGKQPVKVPSGVEVDVQSGLFRAQGPRGSLEQALHPEIKVEYDKAAGEIRVSRPSDEKRHKALHGLTQRLLSNAVVGVSKGFEKRLSIIGIGYNAKIQGAKLVLSVGFANQVEMPIPKDLKIETPSPTSIVVTGADKQKVGQFAAEVRGIRPPEPYKGKGIRYVGEFVRQKQGKKTV